MEYAYNPNEKKSAKVYGRNLRISTKSSRTVCRKLNGLHLSKGKRLVSNMLLQKESIGGKYYTNVAKEMLDLLNSAAANAEFKGLDQNKLIIHVSAHDGFTYRRPRKFKARGQARKVTNIQVVLEQK